MRETLSRAKRKIKRILHVLNPFAGKGRAGKKEDVIDDGGEVYMSESCDDANDFIINACKEDPETCFIVHGGDGTVFRAVNSLMDSGCEETASLKIVPVGSGNDFVRSFEGETGEKTIDVMRFNDKYAINVINVGFDCEVVRRAANLKKKPMISGKMAYILGVVGELAAKRPIDAKITLTYADGTQEIIEEKILLAAVCNGKCYGGGFKLAPDADLSDGILNVEIIRDISRSKFISLVADYKNGTHIDIEKGELKEKFKEIVYYKKCVAVKIEGVKSVCADGELFEESTVEVKVIPHAINYIVD